jgi:uncharacterized phage infection (PIP) family protein YhgE
MPTTSTTPTTKSPFETATKAAKDAFYVTVGLGVMGVQQAKEGQENLRGWLESQVADGKSQFESFTQQLPTFESVGKGWEAQAKQLEERLTALEEKFESILDSLQANLPEQAAELMKQARDAAKAARAQLKDLVSRGSEPQAA